ncbi:alpha-amylase family glycosyl hydrolase [Spirochaeta isovalerica]|uniref:Glycosidase n=1 Tax=Spirochaeta isovalerica TaxID=150 RepID=A0A841R613_9SPIO|nr:alpha-amylase family glycosyl hydrolase [Spirochaeta isovalerica]MBB6479276.1 glycosidase [Spirochaeta isovalerica]
MKRILVLPLFLIMFGCATMNREASEFPEFSLAGGVYREAIDVSVSSERGDRVFYTLDGSTPTPESTEYEGPVHLDSPSLLRVMALKKDGTMKYAMSMYDFDRDPDLEAHLPSPVWTDQIIYFALLDRMNNGDPGNDDQGYGEANVSEETWYSGGDFKGLEEKLDYIKNLGATAVWITPPVKNQWSEGNFGGSHGYWASDFMAVDPHYGDLEAYRSFVKAAHDKGIYVIQDIVVNHTGDYFNIDRKTGQWSLKEKSEPAASPDQLPWSLNDPSVFTEDELKNNSFYHWTPAISDFNDRSQLFTYQLSNLDDINTTNPDVRNLLTGYYRYWLDKVDVDGYRVDTVKYVEPEFFEDFAEDGIRTYARKMGKEDFILFGESWDGDGKFNASYTQGKNGEKRLDSLIYFTLNFAIRNVFGNGNPTSELTEVLSKRYETGYQDPKKLVTFVDNHDMERLINSTTPELVKEAYAFIMTIPGIPQLYYGSEQGMTERRGAMFAGGFETAGKANNRDLFDENNTWYKYFQELTELRKQNSVFRNGKMTIVKDNSGSNGLFAYKLIEGEGGSGREAFVIFNTSAEGKVSIDMDTQFEPGTTFRLLDPFQGDVQKNITAGESGQLTVLMPGQSFAVYLKEGETREMNTQNNSIAITSRFETEMSDPEVKVEGTIDKPATVGLFVDGNYYSSKLFSAGETWSGEIELTSLMNGEHEIVSFIKGDDIDENIYSAPVSIIVKKPFILRTSVSDPSGDENYRMPTNESFVHQQDILGAEVYTSGTDIRIDLEMAKTTDVWSPTINDFDHVLLNIFLKKGDETGGIEELPGLNASVPASMGSWDFHAALAGWASGISDSSGKALSPSPYGEVNHEKNVISVFIPSSSIGNPRSLDGWKIYISTWDEDSGNPRKLTPDGAEWVFGGGDSTTDPLIMDDLEVLEL